MEDPRKFLKEILKQQEGKCWFRFSSATIYSPSPRHFRTFSEVTTFPDGLSRTACLGVTPNSVASFKDEHPTDRNGDYRGFLHVMDPSYKASESKIPDYKGTFKIIDQLVWTDLYPRTSMNTANQELSDYWGMATRHPWGVYVGPTTAVARRAWREMRGGVFGAMTSFLQGGIR